MVQLSSVNSPGNLWKFAFSSHRGLPDSFRVSALTKTAQSFSGHLTERDRILFAKQGDLWFHLDPTYVFIQPRS